MSTTKQTESRKVTQQVGQNFKRLRTLRGLSQAKMAAILGVSFQQVQKYENGANRLSAAALYKAADTLDFPVSDFFEGVAKGTDKMPPTSRLLLELSKRILSITDRKTQRAVLEFLKHLE